MQENAYIEKVTQLPTLPIVCFFYNMDAYLKYFVIRMSPVVSAIRAIIFFMNKNV